MRNLLKRVMALIGFKPVGSMMLTATVIHADGTTTDLGTLAKGKVNMRPGAK